MTKVDLHMHSTCSDGQLPPEVVVERAHAQGIELMALTDHDTIVGVALAQKRATELGITCLSGIELSARWRSQDIHIVGLNFDVNHPVMLEACEAQCQRRQQRIIKMVERLEKLRIRDADTFLAQHADQVIIGRVHVAQFIVKQGYARDIQHAFDIYLKKGKPAYVPTEWPDITEIVTWIKQAGGVAIVAHPSRYKLTRSKLLRMLEAFKDAGGDAIEVNIARQHPDAMQAMVTAANGLQLAVSQGADFHGPDINGVEIGQLAVLPADCRPIWQQFGEQTHESIISDPSG